MVARAGVGGRGYFSKSVDSPSLEQHCIDSRVLGPTGLKTGIHEARVSTLAGELGAAFLVHRWKGPEYPAIIYHHGVQENPFDLGLFAKNTFKTVLVAGKPEVQANLIAVRAPFHDRSVRRFLDTMAYLSNFAAMLGASVAVVEELVRACRSAGVPRLLVSGLSLGGWASNLHHAVYNSADAYIPMLAGTAFGKVFTESEYIRLVGQAGKNQPAKLESVLNFGDAFSRVPHTNVFPVLGRYDRYIDFETQKSCYGHQSILVLDKGHVGAALSPRTLRAHVMQHLVQDLPARQ